MKIEKLFRKAERFFGMDKDEQIKNSDKKEKLMHSLEKKIFSMKEKIKNSDDDERKEELKREVKVLQKLREKIVGEE